MVFNYGSNIHLLTLKDARRLYSEHKTSSLKVIGVSNVPVIASAEGQLRLSDISPRRNGSLLQFGSRQGIFHE
jgi:hypothetical protein